METRVISAHVPVDMAQQLDEAAIRMDRPKGWIVKQAIASWLELEEKRYQMTLEGLADVDAGRVISHEDMVSWARTRLGREGA